jgi:hypothetical protein
MKSAIIADILLAGMSITKWNEQPGFCLSGSRFLRVLTKLKQLIIFLVLAIGLFGGTAESRQIVSYKSYTASVADKFECAERIKLIIAATDESQFTRDRIAFLRLVGSARAALGFECAQIKSILIEGRVGNQEVYQGISTSANNWAVIDIVPKKSDIVKQIPQPARTVKAPEQAIPHGADQQSVSQVVLTGSWRGVYNDQEFELVLWPRSQQKGSEGYLYTFKHDCLMGAVGIHEESRLRIFFGKGLARDRQHNCMANTEGFTGSEQFNFEGDGFVTNITSDYLYYDFNKLVLGKEIVNLKSSTLSDKEKQIVFKKTPLSPELLEIFNNYRNLDISKPDAGILAEITRGTNDTLPTQKQEKRVKPKQNKESTTPYHDQKFLTRWKSELYDFKNKKYIRCTVDADRRSDGKLVLQVRTTDSGQCIVDLIEDSFFADGYVVKLSADSNADCGNKRITRGYLHPYTPKERMWPHLKLFNDEGELVASGPLDGIKGGLPGLHPDLCRGLEEKISASEKEIMLAKLKAIQPQTLYTQCRILEYSWDNVNEVGWCLCLDEQYREKLSSAEYNNAVNDYLSFHRLTVKNPSESGDWRYTNVGNYCRECYENKYKGCLQGDDNAPNSRNYTRILTAFQNGSHDSIKKDMLYKNFFVDYIHAYSDWCGKSITDGIYRERRSWEEDRNTGIQVGQTQVQKVSIGSRYVNIYDQYLDEVNRYDKLRFITGDFGTTIQGFLKSALKETDNAVGARLVLNNHLNQGCSSPEVQKVYQGLLETR